MMMYDTMSAMYGLTGAAESSAAGQSHGVHFAPYNFFTSTYKQNQYSNVKKSSNTWRNYVAVVNS